MTSTSSFLPYTVDVPVYLLVLLQFTQDPLTQLFTSRFSLWDTVASSADNGLLSLGFFLVFSFAGSKLSRVGLVSDVFSPPGSVVCSWVVSCWGGCIGWE